MTILQHTACGLIAWSTVACAAQPPTHAAGSPKRVPEIDPYADMLVNVGAVVAEPRRAVEHAPFLSIDVESLALGDELAGLQRWQLEPLERLGDTLRKNAAFLAGADFVASTESDQTLLVRPTLLLATERYVTIAQQIDLAERSMSTLGSVRMARCATIRRSDGKVLGNGDIFLPGAISRPGLIETASRSPCLVKRGLWLVDEEFNSPVMGDEDTSNVTPGHVVPYAALHGSIREGLLPLSSARGN